jgi:hypothetical protein
MSHGTINGRSRLAGTAAVFLARVLVPAWLAVGAVLKLVDMSPSHLPAAIVKWFGGNGLDLMFVLRFSIAVELVVAVAMVLLPALARWIGIVMLTAFVPVLVGDVALGAASCGCFGAVAVNPWVTLVTDVTCLLGLFFLGRGEPRLAVTSAVATWRVVLVGVATLLAFAVSFGPRVPASPGAPAGATANDAAGAARPADGFYLPIYADWVGRSFRELEIAAWISGLPDDLEEGRQYVLFYRKDCEHCHELMELHFSDELPAPTLAVAVPERAGYPTENLQSFPCGGCGTAELPAGVDWFLQTPVLVRLEDGVVGCAAEVEAMAPQCLEMTATALSAAEDVAGVSVL